MVVLSVALRLPGPTPGMNCRVECVQSVLDRILMVRVLS